MMEFIMRLINENITIFILTLIVFNFILTIVAMLQRKEIIKTNKKYDRLSNGLDNGSLEEIILKYYEDIEILQEENIKNKIKISELDSDLKGCIQKVGLTQYNAYTDTGGNLSFSMALLDANYNGIIITSLYGRHDSVTYGKRVVNKEPQTNISDEEKDALMKAINN